MTHPLKNKIILITGAASGIGKALATASVKQGAKVVLADMNEENLQTTFSTLQHFSTDILAVKTDVSLESDCQHLILKSVERFGGIDVLINNAGISMRALLADASLDVLRRVMAINFWGMVYCTKFALPYLLQSRGSLVGISSVAGYKGLPGRTGYSASKFALQGFLEVVRIENMKNGLHVLIACPGFTASNIRKTALAADGSQQGESPRNEDKLMPAEEVAHHILKAVEKRKDRIILTSQGKLTVLLNKFFPKFMDKMVYNHMAKEPDSPFS